MVEQKNPDEHDQVGQYNQVKNGSTDFTESFHSGHGGCAGSKILLHAES
jgi:hypothetical protein